MRKKYFCEWLDDNFTCKRFLKTLIAVIIIFFIVICFLNHTKFLDEVSMYNNSNYAEHLETAIFKIYDNDSKTINLAEISNLKDVTVSNIEISDDTFSFTCTFDKKFDIILNPKVSVAVHNNFGDIGIVYQNASKATSYINLILYSLMLSLTLALFISVATFIILLIPYFISLYRNCIK